MTRLECIVVGVAVERVSGGVQVGACGVDVYVGGGALVVEPGADGEAVQRRAHQIGPGGSVAARSSMVAMGASRLAVRVARRIACSS